MPEGGLPENSLPKGGRPLFCPEPVFVRGQTLIRDERLRPIDELWNAAPLRVYPSLFLEFLVNLGRVETEVVCYSEFTVYILNLTHGDNKLQVSSLIFPLIFLNQFHPYGKNLQGRSRIQNKPNLCPLLITRSPIRKVCFYPEHE